MLLNGEFYMQLNILQYMQLNIRVTIHLPVYVIKYSTINPNINCCSYAAINRNHHHCLNTYIVCVLNYQNYNHKV